MYLSWILLVKEAYIVYNNRLFTVEESVHVTFDEFYLRNVGRGIPFHDASVSSEDVLKDTEKELISLKR